MSFRELYKNFRKMNHKEIKISFEKPLLYIDQERRFVKCTLRGVLHIPQQVAKSLGFEPDVKIVAKSVATCKEDDVFSTEKGIKIAMAKTEANAYRNASDRLVRAWYRGNDCVVDYIESPEHPTLNSFVNAFVQKANSCIDHNKRYVAKIGG